MLLLVLQEDFGGQGNNLVTMGYQGLLKLIGLNSLNQLRNWIRSGRLEVLVTV
jgi:hypothetical protein